MNGIFSMGRSYKQAVSKAAGLGAAFVITVGLLSGNNMHEAVAQDAAAPKITKDLATGHLAAFVVHKARKPVKPIVFKNGDEEEVSLENWRGRVVLVNLWATWCGPCRKEMPELDALQGELGSDDFEVVALSVDRKGAEASAKFLKQINAKHLKLYIDKTTRANGKLGAVGLPATFLIDRQGNEIGRMFGPADWASEDAKRLISAAIAEGQ